MEGRREDDGDDVAAILTTVLEDGVVIAVAAAAAVSLTLRGSGDCLIWSQVGKGNRGRQAGNHNKGEREISAQTQYYMSITSLRNLQIEIL